mmetsp:Transcript_63321/g.137786  ORF Transcript_63321/g.137786 Transcript_63321/m.137786 type:complete len:91 (-) Transcript_63321:90-362(-)
MAVGAGAALTTPVAARQMLNMIHPELHGDVAKLFLALGFLLTVYFLYYEVSMLKRPMERRLIPQLFVAFLASALLGLGFFLLLFWAGVYA